MALAPQTMPAKLVTTYLHMTDPAEFRPSFVGPDFGAKLTLMHMQGADILFYRFLYSAVGGLWRWRDRMIMPDEELVAALAEPSTRVYVLYVDGIPAGYVELRGAGETTEIAYFGLRPQFIGRGLGKHLLSFGIAQAWADGARSVRVHTCNLDAPHALDNYIKRGFRVVEVREEPMPERYA